MKCPNCGSTMRYLSAGKVYYCEFCKYEVGNKQDKSKETGPIVIREVHNVDKKNKKITYSKQTKTTKRSQKKGCGCFTSIIAILMLLVVFGSTGTVKKNETAVTSMDSNNSVTVVATKEPSNNSETLAVTEEPANDSVALTATEEPANDSMTLTATEEPSNNSVTLVATEEPSNDSATLAATEEPVNIDYSRMETNMPSENSVNIASQEEQVPTGGATQDLLVTPGPLLAMATSIEDIKTGIRDYIIARHKNVEVDRITINKDFGTEAEDDYIALIYLTSNDSNSELDPGSLLEMYSEDIADTVAMARKDIQEICFFWTAPLLNNASGKCSYERDETGMTAIDIVWDNGL